MRRAPSRLPLSGRPGGVVRAPSKFFASLPDSSTEHFHLAHGFSHDNVRRSGSLQLSSNHAKNVSKKWIQLKVSFSSVANRAGWVRIRRA
jgi:hypothetical protein